MLLLHHALFAPAHGTCRGLGSVGGRPRRPWTAERGESDRFKIQNSREAQSSKLKSSSKDQIQRSNSHAAGHPLVFRSGTFSRTLSEALSETLSGGSWSDKDCD